MPQNFVFQCDYRLFIEKSDGSSWSLLTLKSCSANLYTRDAINNMTLVVADPNGKIRDVVQPHAMNKIQLQLKNQYGQWGIAWTGYVDAVHRLFSPGDGEMLQFDCTGSYKLFEITRQTPSQAFSLAAAYQSNVTGSAVLRYACQACGFPLTNDAKGKPWVVIGAKVDSGSGIQGFSGTIGINPDQQTWSAVLQQLVANSGIECFTNEEGRLFWRQQAYLNVVNPRPIEMWDILGSDFIESDQEIVTRIEVRWGPIPAHQTAAFWQAPTGMVTHLRQRSIITYAPWLLDKPSASSLATMLGQQFASGIATGTVTIPADPYFTLGTTVKVALPSNPYLALGLPAALRAGLKVTDNYALYYVSSIQYQLEWGGQWVMTLGLSYGRNKNNSFPYIGGNTVPVLDTPAGVPTSTDITTFALDTDFPQRLATPFTLVAQKGLSPATVSVNGIPAGTVVTLNAPTKSGAGGGTIGPPAGPSHNGEYTVVAAPVGRATNIIGIAPGKWVTDTPSVYVGIRADSQNKADTSSDNTNVQDANGFMVTTGPHGEPSATTAQGDIATGPIAAPAGNSLAMKALRTALTHADPAGSAGHYDNKILSPGWVGSDGVRNFDCAGIVQWSYWQNGYNFGGGVHDSGRGDASCNYWGNATIIYNWFANAHGGVAIPPENAQAGDLLFFGPTSTTQSMGHIAFCYAQGKNFGSNGPLIGPVLDTASTHSIEGDAANYAISMTNVTLNS